MVLCRCVLPRPRSLGWALFNINIALRAHGISDTFSIPAWNDPWKSLHADIGLAPNSTISFEITNDRPGLNIYVIMLTSSQWAAWHHSALPRGLHDSLVSFWRAALVDQVNVTFKIRAPTKNRYHVGILNPQRRQVKIHGRVSIANPGGQQLFLQDQFIPDVLLWASAIFACTSLALRIVLFCQRPTSIHFLILFVITLKGMFLFLGWSHYHQLATYGTDSFLRSLGWRLLDKTHAVAELILFLLVALGWKFLRETLQHTETRCAVGFSLASLYLGIAEISCTSPTFCGNYQLSRYILHSLCYLVIIVAMNFNLQMLSTQLSESPASIGVGEVYRKRGAYVKFRWIFLAFIIAPTVQLFLKITVIPWDALWVYVLVQQSWTWTLYVCIYYAFRPAREDVGGVFELTRGAVAGDDSDNEAALIMDDFGDAVMREFMNIAE